MTPASPKKRRAVTLFKDGHSCAYVAEVIKMPYSRVVRFRNELDLPAYERATDPSRAGIACGNRAPQQATVAGWGGLSTKPPKRPAYRTSAGHAMTPPFRVKRCRFPLWPHGSEPTQEFCGAETWRPGASYCARHHAHCYV